MGEESKKDGSDTGSGKQYRLKEVSEDSFRVNLQSNKYWGRKNEDSKGIALGKTNSFTSI